ncbi:Ig-like domain-containing protein [Eubacterium ventriosum]|uniref:Ig-like domain-containing protein n=1 Tax=Eubacterium ventriosum TaxID=39496 RepID=UPI0024331B23|nr:Ig-like domain-containing protein [Eubacterium ventriosum]
MKVGDTFKLKTKLSKKSAGSVKYISKNKRVIKVNKDGNIKALRKGKAEIIARTYNRKEAKITITVK